MTQSRRILWLAVFVAAVLLLPSKAAAQNYVTPIVKPTPPGQLIVVNNSPGADHYDPHVSGDLVAYSNAVGFNFTIRYHDLLTGTDNAVPNGGTSDFLSDVSGNTIAFTRVSTSSSAIFKYNLSDASATEVDPVPGSSRQSAQIGDQTIAWEEFSSSGTTADIVAFDRQSGAAIRLTSDGMLNQLPAISPDGMVIVWTKSPNVNPPYSTWKAVLSNGTWTAQQVVSQVGGNQPHPDTDGTIIAYSANSGTGDQLVWQPVGGGTEQVLNLQGGQAENPSVSGGPQNSLIAFAYLPTGAAAHDLAIYDVAANVLYDVTKDAMPGNTADKQLSDISVTPDGKVGVVWQQQDAQLDIYAYTFSLPVGDFSLGAISPLTISAGGSGSANVTVNPVNGFSSVVDLSVSGAPVGVTAAPSPAQITPSGGNPATSILNVSVSPALAPTNFTLTLTGTSGTLTHSATADVTVTATTSSIGNLIGNLVTQGCVDNISNALTSKLSAAQGAASTQTEINILTALKNQINAQAGKHIATTCTIGGVAFNPVTVLLLDVQGVIDSLRVSAIPDPITGYVVDMNGVGVPGATVSILDASTNMPVATATTDITGFYFFATMSVLTPHANYTVAVTGLPAGFTSSTPAASPAFPWLGTGMMIGDFVLNP